MKLNDLLRHFRLFGIGTLCLLTVYVFHVSFQDTKRWVKRD